MQIYISKFKILIAVLVVIGFAAMISLQIYFNIRIEDQNDLANRLAQSEEIIKTLSQATVAQQNAETDNIAMVNELPQTGSGGCYIWMPSGEQVYGYCNLDRNNWYGTASGYVTTTTRSYKQINVYNCAQLSTSMFCYGYLR